MEPPLVLPCSLVLILLASAEAGGNGGVLLLLAAAEAGGGGGVLAGMAQGANLTSRLVSYY